MEAHGELKRVYLASSLAWNEPLVGVIEKAAELGADGVEVWAEHAWRNGDDLTAVREAADRLEVRRTVHGPSWDLNLCSIDPWILRASRECTREAVHLAAQIGAEILVVHPGRYSLSGRFEEYHWNELLRSYVEICTLASAQGLAVGLEAMERIPKEFLCDSDSVNRFLDAAHELGAANLGVVVDVAHLTTIATEPLTALAEFRGIIELHISNVKPDKLHTPLDDGTIDMARVIPHLEERYRLPIVIEGLSAEPGFDHLERSFRAYRQALK